MRTIVLTASLSLGLVLGLSAPALAAKTPAEETPALAVVPRLAPAGEKNGALVLLDLTSRRTVDGALDADALLVFPPPTIDALAAGSPAPDHGRITLAFDCKARTIKLTHLVLLAVDQSVMKDDSPKTEPFPPVDPTDARMLGLACGEVFPEAAKTYSSESAAIEAARAPH